MTLPRRMLLVLLVFACAVLGVGVVALSERDNRRGSQQAPVSAPITDGPIATLRDWDRRRARAWLRGDVGALRSLYTRRSSAGSRDVARLSRWVDRGLRLRRIETQVLGARVIEQRRDRLALSVTDRIARALAVHEHREIPLPDDSPSTWRITMRRVAGEWRVAAVAR